jgi:hypothetical protein
LLSVLKREMSILLVSIPPRGHRKPGNCTLLVFRPSTLPLPGSRQHRLGRRQIRAVRVYGVPFLGVDARGLPGRRHHARTPGSDLTGLFEAGIRGGTPRLVALAYPRRVRGRIMRRVRLPYPYVRHLLPPFLAAFFYPSAGGTSASSPSGFGAPPQLLEEPLYLLPDLPAAAQASPAHSDEPY